MKILVLLFLLSLAVFCNGAKILGVFHAPVPSHFILGQGLMRSLAKKGHDVTMVSAFEVKNPPKNLKAIKLDFDAEIKEMQNVIKEIAGKSMYQLMMRVIKTGPAYAEKTLNNTKIQELMKSEEKFDLVIIEAMLNEAHLGLGHHFGCPVAVLSTVGTNPLLNKFVGNPSPSSFVSTFGKDTFKNPTFKDRTINFLAGHLMELYTKIFYIPIQNDMLHKYFPSAPNIEELYKKISLVLLNSHISVSSPKPLVPSMIEIGGFHVEKPEPLPKDLQKYLDSSKNGVILFSLGSNVQSANLEPKTLETILQVLSKLPYDILWKFEAPNLPNKPPNVRIEKWLPQNDILAHKNVKLFITHGGLLSTLEAVYYGVPIVGIPVFGDQEMNMELAIENGIGKKLDFNNLQADVFLETVLEVLKNSSYLENVQKRSSLMKDRPLTPIDNAIYWIEYVIRHKGADYLKTGALELTYIELYQIDVMIFVFLFVCTIIYLPCLLLRLIFSKKVKKIDKTKKLN